MLAGKACARAIPRNVLDREVTHGSALPLRYNAISRVLFCLYLFYLMDLEQRILDAISAYKNKEYLSIWTCSTTFSLTEPTLH